MDFETAVPINIHLTTQIEQDGELSQHVFDEEGQLFQMGSTLYLRYHETNAETNETVPVTLKLQEDGLVILTRGQGNTRLQLHFSADHEINTVYQTPYGNIPIITRTTMMKVRLQDEPTAGEIKVDYLLMSGRDQLGKYQLRLIFQ
ncbi:DUF1934 domain-containing protein [Lapidilactobacillus dextrinicus]|nr:DUF1934 domain-containing protein [Lapidilactobacillus dextrinicus]